MCNIKGYNEHQIKTKRLLERNLGKEVYTNKQKFVQKVAKKNKLLISFEFSAK